MPYRDIGSKARRRFVKDKPHKTLIWRKKGMVVKMNDLNETDLIQAHRFCRNNRDMLKSDKVCGCFYCVSIFSPSEINRWIPEKRPAVTGKYDKWIYEGYTAFCPYCGIDSVIGESSGYPITKNFLERMQKRWFGERE